MAEKHDGLAIHLESITVKCTILPLSHAVTQRGNGTVLRSMRRHDVASNSV